MQNRSPVALKEVHPLGKSPTLVTPTGRVITERSAIALWLISEYDEGARFRLPAGGQNGIEDAAREDQLISLGGATIGPMLMIKLIFGLLVMQAPLLARPLLKAIRHALDRAFLDAELATLFAHLDAQLAGGEGEGDHEWFLGTAEPTRADFCLLWTIDWPMQWGWVDFDKYPRLKAFHARCTERPAWKRALEKGGGYNLKFWA